MDTKKKSKMTILILCSIIAVIALLVHVNRMTNHYIKESGKSNMFTILEQLKQNYDHQIDNYYAALESTENEMFQDAKRSITLDEAKYEIYGHESVTGRIFLFIKDNGMVLDTNGNDYRIEIPDQLLMDLRNGKNIAKLVTGLKIGDENEGYLLAIPCEDFKVDGETYSAVGALYDRSEIDTLFDIRAYGGDAVLFLLDREGYVIYTNQKGEAYYRNYSLLKHLNSADAIDDEQVSELRKDIYSKHEDVKVLGSRRNLFYFGYSELDSADSVLVCMVPKATVDNALVEYQNTIMKSWLIVGALVLIVTLILIHTVAKMKFESEKHDIQEKAMRALEEERNRADAANKSKSDFLSSMSHDIRTPMNAIVGITNLMEHDADDPEKIRSYVSKIKTSNSYLLGLINDVLDMSKIESGEIRLTREPISLAEQVGQIESIIRPQMRDNGHTFTVYVNEIVHEYLIGDAVRLRQVFVNVLSNAVKYTPYGGQVSLELMELPSDNPTKANIQIIVSDTGYGMPAEFIEKIFVPFTRMENSVTNKIQGTGLGMAITKQIVDLQGGTIDVQSEVGKGSTFTITIPFDIDDGVSYEIAASKVMLVADDERITRNIDSALENTALEFKSISLEGASEIIEEEKPDVVMISGYFEDSRLSEIVNSFRQKATDTVLIFCCDYVQSDEVHAAFIEKGLDGVVARPFFFENFANIVNQIRVKRADVLSTESSVLNGMRFLCAEDNELNAEILSSVLALEGAECIIYPNGKELVDAFTNVTEGDYSAILMDVQMPIMNGLEATRKIRNSENPLGKTIPIIAMTANAFSSDVQECLDSGMDAHVAKPLNLSSLKRAVASLTSQNRGGVQVRED